MQGGPGVGHGVGHGIPHVLLVDRVAGQRALEEDEPGLASLGVLAGERAGGTPCIRLGQEGAEQQCAGAQSAAQSR